MITYKLAQEIVTQTMLRLHHNINVMNLDGTILASGDPSRLEHYHAATKEIIQTKKSVYIYEKDIDRYPNTKPGINLPIFFQDEIVCTIGITGNPSEIEDIANLVQLTAEVIVNQALLESQSEWQRKMSVHIFFELIEGSEVKGILKERIHKLPFKLNPPFAVSIIRAKHKTSSHRTLIQFLEDYFYEQPVLYGHYQLDEYYILSTNTNEAALNKMMNSLYTYLKKQFDFRIGVGKVVNELEEIPKSYQTASAAVNAVDTVSELTFYEEIALKSLFKKEEIEAYSEDLLKPLNHKLRQTLAELFKHNLQLNMTAEILQIHRHTLTYRLEKIRELCQLDPLKFEDAIKLQIALWFKESQKKR